MVIDRDPARGVRAERLARTYATLAKADEAILRIRQRLPLFEEVCRVLVEEGQLRMAWVGEIDDHGWIVPVAHAGAARGYLDDLRVSVLDVAEGRGPTGIAARECHHVFSTNIAMDARMAPWRDAALAREFRSSGGFPIVVNDRCVAVLTAYATEPGFFDEEEVALFDRLAADLCLALEAMQRDEQRREVQARLRVSEERFRVAVESLPDPYFIFSPIRDAAGEIVDFRYEYASAAGEALAGSRHVPGRALSEFEPGIVDSTRLQVYRQVMATGEPCRIEAVVPAAAAPGGPLQPRVLELSVAVLADNLAMSARDITELRGVQAQLAASQERYRRALSALSEGIVVHGKDGAISSCNAAAERILGLSAEEMIGRSSLDPGWSAIRGDGSSFLGEEHPAMVTLRTGRPQEGVLMGVHKPDGELIWISINSMPFHDLDEDAGEHAVVTSFTDVTARQSADARLRESEERFQAAIRTMQDAVAIQSPVRDETGEIVDFRYDYVNDAHCEVVGRDREQVLGHRVGEVFPDWSRSERFEVYRQVMLTGTPVRTEDFHPEQAWGTRFARRALDVVVARAGEQVVVSARDVTDRRRIEAQLRASEERFDAAVGSMLDAFTIISPVRDDEGGIVDFRWAYVNEAYCALVELDRDEMIGHRLSERYPGWPTSARFVVYCGVSDTGEPCLSVDVAEPEAWAGGRLASRVLDTMIVAAGENVVVTARDVTERYRLEEQLRASEELFRTGVGSLLDGFTICSPVRDEMGKIIDFRWEYANDAACARNGLTREQMLGQRISEVLPGYTDTDVFQLHRRVAQTGEPARVDEVSWQAEWVAGQQVDRAYDGSVVPLGPNIIVTGRDVTNARRNERELRLQAELLELAHDAVIVRDPVESRVTFWNREAEAIYGYSRAEALGQVTHELLAMVFPESTQAVDDSLARDGQWGGVLRHTRKDGGVITVSSRQALQRDSDGRALAIIELNSDITARERAEREREQALAELEEAQQIAQLGSWRWDPDAGRRFWSAGMYVVYGCDPAAGPMDTTQSFAFVHADDLERVQGAYARMREGGVGFELDYRLVTVDGVRAVHAIARPDPDEPGCYRGTLQDITERTRNELALRQAREQLELAQRIAELGSFSTNPASGETVWSAELFRIFGRAPADGPLRASELLAYVDADDAELLRAAYEGALADDTRAELDFRVRAGDGAERIVHMIVRRDRSRAGFCSGTVQDVTRLRAVERALREQSTRAESASRAKSEFLARMSHELRTPLNSIIGFSQLLELEGLEPRQNEHVGYVLKAGGHLLELINEVLELAKIEAGQASISLEPVALADTVGEALALLAPLAGERDVTLEIHTNGLAHDGHVHADRQRLEQVLLNVLSNAIKYNRAGGRVDVSFKVTAAGRVRTTIADTGIGIEPEQLGKLFEPFERLGAERTQIEGTGLGLALSNGLVDAMGGTIEVTSEPGAGTTVTIELAGAQPPAGEDDVGAHEPAELAAHASKRQVILYIEDNLSNLTLVERILQRYPGVELLPAMQATIGLELARQHRPDLIVLDLHLPDMPGSDVLKRLKADQQTREIPVVVLTADASNRQQARVTQLGAAAYLTKPLDVPGFLEVIARNLEATPRRR